MHHEYFECSVVSMIAIDLMSLHWSLGNSWRDRYGNHSNLPNLNAYILLLLGLGIT